MFTVPVFLIWIVVILLILKALLFPPKKKKKAKPKYEIYEVKSDAE